MKPFPPKEDKDNPQIQKSSGEFSPDVLGEIPLKVATFAFWGGLLVLVGAVVTTALLMIRASDVPGAAATLSGTIAGAKQAALIGTILVVAGSCWLYWEEEIMVAGHLLGAVLVMSLPQLLGISKPLAENAGVVAGREALEGAGKLYLGLAVAVLVIDVVIRVKSRATHGMKADQLKYKGAKEVGDRQNVFMGKCWQLPYCRKFVRDKCPIYHAKRTCWRELVGCMCEESVIRGAMENRVVSKEALLSGDAIPRNNKLPDSAKRERCRNCVIYNEHQKHKYKLSMPLVFVFYGLIFLAFRESIAAGVRGFISNASSTASRATAGMVDSSAAAGDWFVQVVTLALLFVALAYTIRLIEYALFKLKV